MSDAHTFLKTATGSLHARAEQAFDRFDLRTDAGYRDFLQAQARAFLPLEAVLEAAGVADLLPDWPERRRGDLLRADLTRLGLSIDENLEMPTSAAGWDAIGVAYVLEGSRHGAAILLKRVVNARHASAFATAFLGQPFRAAPWRSFLDVLERTTTPERRPRVLAGAEGAFRLFETGALEQSAISQNRLVAPTL